MNLLEAMTTLFALPRCLGCGDLLSDDNYSDAFCPPCEWSLIQWPRQACKRCGTPIAETLEICGPCILSPPLLRENRAAYVYGGPLRHAILDWKKAGASGAGTEALAEFVIQNDLGPNSPELFWVPIPPNPKLQRKRNFLPVRSLAQALAKKSSRGAVLDVLIEKERTSGRNVKRRFAVTEKKMPTSVLLIDDVQTSGRTAKAATTALRQNGVNHVSLWTLARSASALPTLQCSAPHRP